MAEYCRMSLSMPENAWINCPDYARVLNMPQYSYNNIIIVNNNCNIINSCLLDLYIQTLCYHFIFFQHELDYKVKKS